MNDRPDLIGDPNSGLRSPNEWFNRGAFAPPTAGTFGNSGRNVIIGPDLRSFDFSVNKLTKVTERASVQFRAEIINAFNRANFSLPNVDFNSTTFGSEDPKQPGSASSVAPSVTSRSRLMNGMPSYIHHY